MNAPLAQHISCGCIMLRKNDLGQTEVLLLHRKKSPSWQYDSWHLPKGTKDGSESDEETVMREVFEETGYKIRVLHKVGELHSTYERNNQTITKLTKYFLCEELERVSDVVTEHDEIKWVELEKAKELLASFPIYEKEEDILALVTPL
ncbi:MAG TPA: NUDIX domain-containing protein [Patescibacteria group bacterium]|nr:NUDIX domain-containing protein [Patescibacteria group bacterium]